MLRSLTAQGDYGKIDEIWDKLVKKKNKSESLDAHPVPSLKRLNPIMKDSTRNE